MPSLWTNNTTKEGKREGGDREREGPWNNVLENWFFFPFHFFTLLYFALYIFSSTILLLCATQFVPNYFYYNYWYILINIIIQMMLIIILIIICYLYLSHFLSLESLIYKEYLLIDLFLLKMIKIPFVSPICTQSYHPTTDASTSNPHSFNRKIYFQGTS